MAAPPHTPESANDPLGLPAARHSQQAKKERARGYKHTLKASSITGVSTIVILLLTVCRTKVIAVLLGPGGIGFFGVLTSLTSLVSTIAGLGINSSGVRQVSEAVATGDNLRIARVVYTLRRTSLVLGILGAVFIILFSRPLSHVSLGSTEHAGILALLGLTILFGTVNGGQTALLRGLRKIGDLAKLNIWGAFWGTALAIPFVWLWKLQGVAPAMVIVSGMALLASWWFARRVQVPRVRLTSRDLKIEASALLGLGAVFLVTGVLGSAVQYGLRVILLHKMDLNSVGQFLAAAGISAVSVNFILQAMSLDYYPRLTAAAQDNTACNRIANEQSEISMLLAGPGILATVVFAPWLIKLLYSGRFTEADQILRWQCLGMLLRVASWPIAFILLAKGKRRLFLVTETAAHLVHLLAFGLLTWFAGLTGASLAFAVLYSLYLPMIIFTVTRVSRFSWEWGSVRAFLITLGFYGFGMFSAFLLPPLWQFAVGVILVLGLSLHSYRVLSHRLESPLATLALRRIRGFAERAFGRSTPAS